MFRDKLYAIHEKPFKKILANVPLVTDEFSIYEFDKSLIFKRFAIIYINWRYHEVEQLAFLIAYQVEFESKELAPGAFASLCDALEGLVNMGPLILAYTQRGTVNKTNSCTLAK